MITIERAQSVRIRRLKGEIEALALPGYRGIRVSHRAIDAGGYPLKDAAGAVIQVEQYVLVRCDALSVTQENALRNVVSSHDGLTPMKAELDAETKLTTLATYRAQAKAFDWSTITDPAARAVLKKITSVLLNEVLA